MASEQLLQASRDGDVEAIQGILGGEHSAELINERDASGMTALAYAAQNGNAEAVRELLQRGADKSQVLEQGIGQENEAISQLFSQGEHFVNDGQREAAQPYPQSFPVDMHGGQQMPDGAISYVNAGEVYGQGFPVMQRFNAGMSYGQPFFPEGMQQSMQPNFGHPRRNGPAHGRKDSNAVNLPPPEIARMIPCKYFPNCRYGDKCVFAHPIGMAGPMAPPLPPQASPMSPSLSSPPLHMQPGAMFYQQMPPGYPYPPYGGAPSHFMAPPMGPMNPNVQPYHHGLPPPFIPPVMHQQQHEQQQSSGDEQQEKADVDGPATEPAASQPLDETHQKQAEDAASNESPEATEANGTHQPDNAVYEEDGVQSHDNTGNRKHSANSTLHHEAAPFQPQVNKMDAGASIDATAGSSSRNLGGKPTRRVGANGSAINGFAGKRSNNNGERPACTFFQNGRCKYGDECRFPHLLADGTDARPLQAQQRQAYNAQMGLLSNGPASSGRVSGNSASGSGAPASAPTAPQADKRAQQQAAQAANGQQQAPTAQGSNAGKSSGKGNSTNANGVVRSQPSKTSAQSNGSGSRGQSGSKKQSRQQQQQQQQQRVPTTSDFPALSPNPNVSSNAVSPLETPPIVVADAPTEVNGANVQPAKVSSASKVNFSAILSAPAPTKSKAAENGSSESKAQPETGATEASEASSETAEAPLTSSPAPPPKTHAAAAAAAIAGSTQGTAIVVRPTQTKVNGVPAKEKSSSSSAQNGATRTSKSAQPNSYKAAVTSPTPAKANGAPAGSSASDDEFQLVNRSSRSSHKRPSHGNSKGDGYAPQAKAVAA